MAFEITEMWAFVSVETDGEEGVIAFTSVDGVAMPLVGADPARVEALRPLAKRTAAMSGRQVKLKRFTTMTVVETFEPPGGLFPCTACQQGNHENCTGCVKDNLDRLIRCNHNKKQH